MIAADVEIVFVGIAIADYACFKVVSAWWSDGRVGGCVGGETEGEIEYEEKGRKCEVHSGCLCSRKVFPFCLFGRRDGTRKE